MISKLERQLLDACLHEAELLAGEGHAEEGYQALLAGLRHAVPANRPHAPIGLRFFNALDEYARRHGLMRTRIVARFAHAVAHVVHADSLVSADLSGVYLGPVSLAGEDLREARLIRTDLYNSDLSGAVLRDAQLTGAVLAGANLQGANLAGVVLFGCDLTGAAINGAVLHDACYDDATRWPEGFPPRAAGVVRYQEDRLGMVPAD